MNSHPPSPDPADPKDDDISTAPFVDIPPFSRGLWRRPVPFVAASTTATSLPQPAPKPLSIADQYLAIVFPNGGPKPAATHPLCPTCKEPITQSDSRAHYLSLGHQMSLPRAAPPSAIDRSRMGLKYMEKYGWDVDARKGLGAQGEGMLYPIVPREKRDAHGIGLVVGEKKGVVTAKAKESLDAKKVQLRAKEEKKRAEKLQRMFYGDDEVERYLQELDAQMPGAGAGAGKGIDMGGFRVAKKGRRK